MSQLITDITIQTFANAAVIRSNIAMIDNLTPRFGANIGITGNLIPTLDGTYSIGDDVLRLKQIHSNDVYANTFHPQNNQTITFFGNLFPNIDDVYYLGVPQQRWRHLYVDDMTISGNAALSGPSTLIDAYTNIIDDVDPTKKFQFQASSISSGQTRVYTVQDVNDTFVYRTTTDTLINKTLTSNSDNVIARALWDGSGTGSVSTYAAAAPITGQVLTATTATTATWQTPASAPVTFVDTTFAVYDVTDNTKAIKLDAAGTTGTSTTLLSSQTTNKILTLPNATDTLVARSTTDTLTNKTLTDNTNNILARGLWNGTGTGSVSTYTAAAPVTGQILVATTPTTATWQTLSSITPTTFVDTTFAVYDVTDNTKAIKLDAAGTTGTNTTLLSSQTTNKVLTLPDATDTLVARATTDTLTNKTLTDNTNNVIARQLWVGSGTGSVSTYAAAAPTLGQRLVATSATTATWQTDPTTFVDTTFAIYDVTDQTKSIKFDAAGTTGTNTTLLSSQTTNKTLTLPDATDTLVARATTDTLTNKTLTDNTNNVLARGLWDGSGTGSVSTYAAAAPTTGQILVATTPTTATWQTLSSITPTTFVDTTFAVYDVTDNTKAIKLDAAGTTGTNTTLLSSQTTNKVLTLPDATDTLVARATTDTLTNKTLTDNTNNVIARQLWVGSGTGSVSTYAAAAPTTGQILVATTPTTATWQTLSSITPTTFVDTTFAVYDVTDNTKAIKLDAAGTTGTSTTLLSSQTTNKTLTLPDATDTIVARATTDTLTNKTLTDNTNNVIARQLWVGSGTGSVSTYAAAAPTLGQRLVATSATTATWQTDPTTFVDTTFAIYDVTDQTKSIKFDAAGTTGTNTTLLSSQTTNKVLTLPDATDTLVARATTDTLTNKTLTNNTNNVLARGLWNGTGTGSVSTYAAAAPVTGQILVATTPTTATWQTLSSITPTTFVDTTFAVYDVTDNTKAIKLDAAGTTGTNTTLLSSQTTNKVLTLPDATDTLVARTTTDTLTNKTLTDNTNNVISRQMWVGSGTGSVSTYAAAAPITGQVLTATSTTTAIWQTPVSAPNTFVDSTFAVYDVTDNTKAIKLDAAGTTGTSTTLLSSQTTNKVLTLPDATDTLVARATTDTLTNKTLTANTNNVIARQLWVGSGTGSVSTYTAAAPVTGQILVATTPTTATWQTLSSITPTTFVDTTFAVYDVTDNTKAIKLDAAGTTGTSTTLLSSQTTNKVLTLPDATDTLVARATTDTLTNKTLTDNTNNVLSRGLWNGSGTGSVSTYAAAAPTIGQRLVATSATTATWQFDATTFVDTTFAIYDVTDQTKNIKFDAAGTTGTSTTLLSSQTTNKVLTLPDATDTLVARATTDTLTNKTLTDATNNVIARQLWVGSGTGSVSTYAAAAPVTGQILVATTPSTATWQSLSSITPTTFVDTTFAVYDVTNNTISIKLDAAGTTGTSTTLLSSQTTNKVLTLPDATDTLVARATTDTLTNKTLTDATNNVIARQLWVGSGTGSVSTYAAAAPVTGQVLTATSATTATWQPKQVTFVDTTFAIYDVTDQTKNIKFDAAGTTGTSTTLLSSQTTNKTLTLPDATDTLVARATTDTLTNKTLTDATNNVIARQLWVGSGTGSVSTYAAAAPVTGQVLTATSATTATWQPKQVTFVDTTFAIYDVTDQTKNIKFDAAGTTGTSTTLLSSQTTNKTLTLPDATDTLVARATTDTLTNKTLTDNTNNIISRGLWDGSGTGSVSVYAAAAPTTGQVLMATNSTTATWQTPSASTSLTYTEVSATTDTSTTSTTYTQINSMTVTPAAGTWLVMFSSSGNGDSTGRNYNYAIHKAGTIVQHSERNLNFGGGSQVNLFDCALHTQAIVTVSGSDIIDIKYKGTSGTFTVHERSMELIRVA